MRHLLIAAALALGTSFASAPASAAPGAPVALDTAKLDQTEAEFTSSARRQRMMQIQRNLDRQNRANRGYYRGNPGYGYRGNGGYGYGGRGYGRGGYYNDGSGVPGGLRSGQHYPGPVGPRW